MKNSFFTRLFPLLLLILIPFAAFADPNYDGLAEMLIGIAVVLLILVLVSLIAGISYFRKGGNPAFYIALITGLILYAIFGFVTPLGDSPSLSLFNMIPLVPLGILCWRPVKFKSTSILPYAAMSLIVMSVASMFVATLPLGIRGYRQTPLLSLIFSLASIALFTRLFVKVLLQTKSNISEKNIFLKANYLTLLAFAISLGASVFSILVLRRNRIGNLFGTNLVLEWLLPSFASFILEWLLPMLLVANVTTWFTLRSFGKRTDDDFAGPPL